MFYANRTQPCNTPTTVRNQSNRLPSNLTALVVSLYKDSRILMILTS